MKAIHDAMLLIDGMGNHCYYGVESYIVLDYATFFTLGGIGENVLFNLGFMFTDIVEILLNGPDTIHKWTYYVAYRVGDFAMRFFYKDEIA